MIRSAAAASRPGRQETGHDRLLCDRLRGLGRDRRNAYAAHLHLSRIKPIDARLRAVEVALRPLAALAERRGAELFRLSNTDLVLVCHEIPLTDMDAAIARVRRLFRAEAIAEIADSHFEDPLVTWFDLSRVGDQGSLLTAVAALSADAAKAAPKKPVASSRQVTGRPLDPINLTAIGRKLKDARIADLIRQQTAIEFRPGGRGEPLFRETYVSMSDLQDRIAPGVSLLESTSLFRYLTEALDKHVLTTIPRRGLARGPAPISLNLNISSLASGEFHLFHKERNDTPGRPVIEIQLVDILADVDAFAVARETLREHGYRVLVDGLSPLTLEFFDVSLLNADFVKICWSRDDFDGLCADRTADLRQIVARTGAERMLIARVDCDDAIRWALDLGITRFQGRYIDKVIQAMSAGGSF